MAGLSALLSSLYSGRRIVYLPPFEPEAWVSTAIAPRHHSCHGRAHDAGAPARCPRGRGTGVPTLRNLSYGGGRVPTELVERGITALPLVNFVNAYGLTETSSTIAMLTPDDHRAALGSDDPVVRARLASLGRPLPNVEVEIRDPDVVAVPVGTAGEIWVRGEQVASE